MEMVDIGTINGWRKEKIHHNKPNWEHPEHETPFGALAKFIMEWPVETPIAEQSEPYRHQCFMELIAGYPVISPGRRPLDQPLHPKSQLSFYLSSFLDKIPTLGEENQWHSVTTFLLHCDLNHGERGVSQAPYPNHFQYFVNCVRKNSTFGQENSTYEIHELHPEEKLFIASLHNIAPSSKKYWPTKMEENLEFKHMFEVPNLTINFSGQQIRRNFRLHTFKFAKIQTWIRSWSGYEVYSDQEFSPFINLNISHASINGASAILDSVSAVLRSHILRTKRPGSIVIDGGGRISYLTTMSLNEELKWLKATVEKAFLLDTDHVHPFQGVLQKTATQYLSCELVREKVGENGGDFEELQNQAGEGAGKRFFAEQLSGSVISHLLPPVHFFETPKEDGLENTQPRNLLTKETETPWQLIECCLCRKASNPTNNTYSSPLQLLKKGDTFVCFFHVLLHEIGVVHVTRNKKLTGLYTATDMLTKNDEQKIRHLLKFDGNAIGALFLDYKTPVSTPPGLDSATISRLDKLSTSITTENLHRMPDDLLNKMITYRHSVLIQRQRRSTNFNTSWWSALDESLRLKNMNDFSPWITAGDDILFANESANRNQKEIIEWLEKFVEKLTQSIAPGIPLSIAGSLVERKQNFSIFECFLNVTGTEKLASNAWKRSHINNNGTLVPEQKRGRLSEFEKDHGDRVKAAIAWFDEDANRQYSFNWNGVENFILPGDWESG